MPTLPLSQNSTENDQWGKLDGRKWTQQHCRGSAHGQRYVNTTAGICKEKTSKKAPGFFCDCYVQRASKRFQRFAREPSNFFGGQHVKLATTLHTSYRTQTARLQRLRQFAISACPAGFSRETTSRIQLIIRDLWFYCLIAAASLLAPPSLFWGCSFWSGQTVALSDLILSLRFCGCYF